MTMAQMGVITGAGGSSYTAGAGIDITGGVVSLPSSVAGNGLGYSSGVLSVGVDGSSIEINADALRVKALGITNAMLAGSIVETKLTPNAPVTKTADFTATSAETTILCNASGEFTITLPTAVGIAGKRYAIRKIDATAFLVTIATTSGQTINGDSAWYLKFPGHWIEVESDGANWQQTAGQSKGYIHYMGKFYASSGGGLGMETFFTPNRTKIASGRNYAATSFIADCYSGSTLDILGSTSVITGITRSANNGNAVAVDNTYAWYAYCVDTATPPKIVRCLMSDNFATTSTYTGVSNQQATSSALLPCMCKNPANSDLYYAYPVTGVKLMVGRVDGSATPMTLTGSELEVVASGLTRIGGMCVQNGSLWVLATVSGAVKVYKIHLTSMTLTTTYTPSGTDGLSSGKLLPLGSSYLVLSTNQGTNTMYVMNTADGTFTAILTHNTLVPMLTDPVDTNKFYVASTSETNRPLIWELNTNGSTTINSFKPSAPNMAGNVGTNPFTSDGYRLLASASSVAFSASATPTTPTGSWGIVA